jgi:hypothetical protein
MQHSAARVLVEVRVSVAAVCSKRRRARCRYSSPSPMERRGRPCLGLSVRSQYYLDHPRHSDNFIRCRDFRKQSFVTCPYTFATGVDRVLDPRLSRRLYARARRSRLMPTRRAASATLRKSGFRRRSESSDMDRALSRRRCGQFRERHTRSVLGRPHEERDHARQRQSRRPQAHTRASSPVRPNRCADRAHQRREWKVWPRCFHGAALDGPRPPERIRALPGIPRHRRARAQRFPAVRESPAQPPGNGGLIRMPSFDKAGNPIRNHKPTCGAAPGYPCDAISCTSRRCSCQSQRAHVAGRSDRSRAERRPDTGSARSPRAVGRGTAREARACSMSSPEKPCASSKTWASRSAIRSGPWESKPRPQR